MAGTDELLARLQQLENGYYGDKKAAREKQFFDTYGERFSNNRGIGLAILNELDARGIDTSAADEAVQQILDTLRTDCNEIIQSIKEVQQEAIENAQKVEAINDAVTQAVNQNPDSSIGGETPMIEQSEMPPEANPDIPVDQGPMPEGMDTENPDTSTEPVDQGPAPEEPPAPTPEDQGPAPGELPAPEEPNKITSDARMKNIRSTLTAKRTQRLNSFKPSAGILEAASRGY